MPLPVQSFLLCNSNTRLCFYLPNPHTGISPAKPPAFYLPASPKLLSPFSERFPLCGTLNSWRNRSHWDIRVHDSDAAIDGNGGLSSGFNVDAFLSFAESVCLVSSVAIAVGCTVYWFFFRHRNLGLMPVANKALVWLLAAAVVFGALIRRRQWRTASGVPFSSRSGLRSGNVMERTEKLEESLRSATTIIRMLSRQLEKLGIRFRVTRKAFKDAISEAAALAHKNSEAVCALAVQEEILGKELAEVQKVLLAMQDQQQKQLELILAMAKNGKMCETKQGTTRGSDVHEADYLTNEGLRQADSQKVQANAS